MADSLIQPAQLSRLLDEEPGRLSILDCRATLGQPSAGYRAFLSGHIPGARHLDLDRDLANPPGSGGRHPLPERAALARRLTVLGVANDHQLVVYDDAGGAFAARAWWCLRWLGHPTVALLDGGLGGWTGSLEEGPGPQSASPTDFQLNEPLVQCIGAAPIAAGIAAGAPPGQLVDARALARFEGQEEPIDPVAGHIPGAVCRPFQGNLDSAGRFLPPEQLRQRFEDLPQPLISYCGSGVTAAHNVLACRIAGLPEPLLYAGSWSDWITDPARPIARGSV